MLGHVVLREHERALDLLGGDTELDRGDRWRAALLRGRALQRLGRSAESLSSFQEAARLAPDRPEPVIGAARSLEELSRFEEARDLVLAALRGAPDDIDLLELGVRLSERSGQGRRARRLQKRLHRRVPA
ncbi:MAG: tetratricopeptide repeat protein [Planctomycetota bacterium]